MKYTIKISSHSTLAIQLLRLEIDDFDDIIKAPDLNSVYYDWVERKNDDFALNRPFLTHDTEDFYICVRDENKNRVFESDDVDWLLDKDLTYNKETGNSIEGFEFIGIKDGVYLLRYQEIKGCCHLYELELDEEFDPGKLYVIKDKNLNQKCFGIDYYPLDDLYYQKGETPNLKKDRLKSDYLFDSGEFYYDTFVCGIQDRDKWEKLK